MWFWLSLIALLCWSGSDLFSKIGCQGEDDHLAHLKMVIAVGTVMGLHAAFEFSSAARRSAGPLSGRICPYRCCTSAR